VIPQAPSLIKGVVHGYWEEKGERNGERGQVKEREEEGEVFALATIKSWVWACIYQKTCKKSCKIAQVLQTSLA